MNRRFPTLAVVLLALSLGAAGCGRQAAPGAAATAPPSTAVNADGDAYCDAVHSLAASLRVAGDELRRGKRGDRAILRDALAGTVTYSKAARDAAPADLPDDWDPVVEMFTAYNDAAEQLDYRMANRRADRLTESLPMSDGAFEVLARDAKRRCGVRW